MRYSKAIQDVIESDSLQTPLGFVTVEADWQLETTDTGPNWGDSIRGPFRYFQQDDDSQVETVLPNIKTINVERAFGNDIASCTISMYNQWHDQIGNGAPGSVVPDEPGVLGKPGYFWPGHGATPEAQAEWNQSPAIGAVEKDGSVNAGFEWAGALVPYALLRTYQGYLPYLSTSTTLQDHIDAAEVLQTGVWIIETIEGGNDGMLTITCKDIGKLLLDQIILPPLIPDALYPLEYVPAGTSAFDSYWEPDPHTGVERASQGMIPIEFHSRGGSYDVQDQPGITTQNVGMMTDGKRDTFFVGNGCDNPNKWTQWFQFEHKNAGTTFDIDQLALIPWAGGYTCYLSVYKNGAWQGTDTIPAHSSIDEESLDNLLYTHKFVVPRHIPDGQESVTRMEIDTGDDVQYIRVTFQNMYYGNLQGQTPASPYRCGIRNIVAYSIGDELTGQNNPGGSATPWTYAMAAHPTRGYWVADSAFSGGHPIVYGYGDAKNRVSYAAAPNNAGVLTISPGADSNANNVMAMAAHPDGEGFWILYRSGEVLGYGSAHLKEDLNGWLHCGPNGAPGLDNNLAGRPANGVGNNAIPTWGSDAWGVTSLYLDGQAMDIAATHTGEGYFILLSDGRVCCFGDATDADGVGGDERFVFANILSQNQKAFAGWGHYVGWEPQSGAGTDVSQIMQPVPIVTLVPAANPLGFVISYVAMYNVARRGTAIAAHPTKPGMWMTTGSGEIFSVGVPNFGGTAETSIPGGLDYRVYNKGSSQEFRLTESEFTHSMKPTPDGNGLYMAFGSGHIAQFGTAVGKGPTDFYQTNPQLELDITQSDFQTWEFFRALIWSIAPDPDGSGFWLLAADGSVGHYDAKFWGQPGFFGNTGFEWFEGNYSDYVDIVKEVLLWSGWLLKGTDDPNEPPPVWGSLESTGIPADARFPGDKFDKRTVLDVINELKQIVGFSTWIDHDGSFQFTSPNWWQAGNISSYTGFRLWLDQDGNETLPNTAYDMVIASADNDPNMSIIPGIIDDPYYYDTPQSEATKNGIVYPSVLAPTRWASMDAWFTNVDGGAGIYPGTWPHSDQTSLYGQCPHWIGPLDSRDPVGVMTSMGELFPPDHWNQGQLLFTGVDPDFTNFLPHIDMPPGLRIWAENENEYWEVSADGYVFELAVGDTLEMYIPTLDEDVDLLGYTSSLSGNALRSQITIGNDTPDTKDPTSTGFITHYPSSATADIRPGVPSLRGIVKPAMWINDAFRDDEELHLMAELVNLQIWFSQRVGSATALGNPQIDINDQVNIKERNTSEVFSHYIRGHSSSMDLDTGSYTSTFQTNWLGLPDNWVISADVGSPPEYNRINVSNRTDTWQGNLGLGLASTYDSINYVKTIDNFENYWTPGFTNAGQIGQSEFRFSLQDQIDLSMEIFQFSPEISLKDSFGHVGVWYLIDVTGLNEFETGNIIAATNFPPAVTSFDFGTVDSGEYRLVLQGKYGIDVTHGTMTMGVRLYGDEVESHSGINTGTITVIGNVL